MYVYAYTREDTYIYTHSYIREGRIEEKKTTLQTTRRTRNERDLG